MTGFGKGETIQNQKKITIEAKSVNHRYGDISIRMPKKFNYLEHRIRSFVKEQISRGKIDLYISYEDLSEQSNCISVNQPLIREYIDQFHALSEKFKLENDITISYITQLPEVLKLEEQEIDEESIWGLLEPALQNCVNQLVEMRITEGKKLREDLLFKIKDIDGFLKKIEENASLVVSEYRDRLQERLQDLIEQNIIDESRLAAEIAIIADKSCIDEEIVRLKSHIEQIQVNLDSKGPVGRKLDFITQEMNREANTIASKANNLHITNAAIGLKSEIEKIKEQIQNIE